jgi:hypothetical protein
MTNTSRFRRAARDDNQGVFEREKKNSRPEGGGNSD